MSACRDPQHERFARELAEQYLVVPPAPRPVFEAFQRAGYAPHKGNATRLAKRSDVRRRVAELLEEAREYADIRIIKALLRVERVADAKLPEYYEREGDGKDARVKLRDITTLPARLAEAIAEVEFDPETCAPRRIKLHDKNAANFALLKHFGAAAQSDAADERGGDVNILNVFGNLNPDDQRLFVAALRDLAAARRAGQPGAGSGAPAPAAGQGAEAL